MGRVEQGTARVGNPAAPRRNVTAAGHARGFRGATETRAAIGRAAAWRRLRRMKETSMRPLVLALAVAACGAGPALAQTSGPGANGGKAPQAAPAKPAAKYTLETPIEELMENPVTLAWLDRHFPGLSERMKDPEVATLFAGVSIEGLSIDPDHGRALTPEVMAKLKASLEKAQTEAAP
jgi:hypothetical protein